MMYDTLINKILGATGPPKGPPGPPIFLSADPILTALISTPVQFYLTWRVHKFSGVSVVIVFICMLSLSSLGAAIAMTTLVTMFPAFTEFGRFIPAAATWLISSAVADVLITGSLIATLSRRRTGMAITDSMINKIIIFTIETGLITAAFAVADAILFLSLPDAAFNFIPDFALSKLYTNTLLASLNVRSQRSSDMNRSEVILHVSGVGRDGVPHTTRGGDFAMSVSNPTSTRTSSLHFAGGRPKREQVGPWGGRRSSDSLDEESELGNQ
ncbi:hypothetical protein ONZ45_g1547 [Pleurotus djamor]|nr:hypothetical protein ONZ45_g1547 [Pleurotus djamor]